MNEAKKKTRRRYGGELKQQILAECAEPGASVASIALSQRIKEYCETEKKCAASQFALAWCLANPIVTSIILGPRTMEQLDGGLRALEIELDDAALTRLDEIFPGYRPAPMEYAW